MPETQPQDDDRPTPYNPTISLISLIIPLALFAAQSLHMRYALRPWLSLSKLGHVLLRMFFPESIIWFVGREEWERRWVVREIKRRLEEKGLLDKGWNEGSALQKLMSIQGGRVYFRLTDEHEGGEGQDDLERVVPNPDDSLPAMPELPAIPELLARGLSQRSPEDRLPVMPGAFTRRPSQQDQQQQAYTPRRSPYYSPAVSPYSGPYLPTPSSPISPLSAPLRPTPPYPISEYNLPLDDLPPPVPPHPPGFRRPSAPEPHSHVDQQQPARPHLHRNPTSESQATAVLLNANTNQPPIIKSPPRATDPYITWHLHPQTDLRRLVPQDIPLYLSVLPQLPPGSPTSLSMISLHLSLPPDFTTVLLIFQLVWVISNIAFRASSAVYSTSVYLLEIYAVYSLIAFLVERVILVGCRRPAWGGGTGGGGGYVVVNMNKSDYIHDPIPASYTSRRTHQYFWIPLILMGIVYPIVLIIYCVRLYKPPTASDIPTPPHIPAVMGTVAGVYILSVLGFLGAKLLERQGREPVGDWSRWIPKANWILWGLVGVGRVLVWVWGVWQVVQERRWRGVGWWEGWWGWPHIGG